MNVYISIESVKYIILLIILVFLVLLFQYLIYALSLNKEISYKNFKDTLLEKNEIEHPIKFLFPEFDFFFELEESFIDNENPQKLLEIADSSIDVKKALQIEKEFKEFISNNLEKILEYEIVIKMKRKGKAIFDDLVEEFPALEKLVPYTDYDINYNPPHKIKDRNILIFDDSIHKGDSARNIIRKIKKIGYKKILLLTVIAQKDSLESLSKDSSNNENISFLQYKIEDENGYRKFYADYMFGYLDHVNRSLEHDNALIKIKVDKLIELEKFKTLLSDKRNYVYEVERFVEKENEYKISLECPWLYNKMRKSYFKNVEMDMVKVRFFVKLNPSDNINPYGTTDINLSPALIPREFNESFCNKSKTKEICMLNNLINFLNKLSPDLNIEIKDLNEEINDMYCINCVIRNLTTEFVGDFMKYFKIVLIDKFNANIIEEKILFPFPDEIYRLKLMDMSHKKI